MKAESSHWRGGRPVRATLEEAFAQGRWQDGYSAALRLGGFYPYALDFSQVFRAGSLTGENRLLRLQVIFWNVRGARRFRNGTDGVGFSSEGAPMSDADIDAVRFTDYDVVRILLGLVLLTVAGLTGCVESNSGGADSTVGVVHSTPTTGLGSIWLS